MWVGNGKFQSTPVLFAMEVQTKISRYGVSRVEPTLAHDAPGPLPRRDPPQTTSGFRRRCGARPPQNNATGQTASDQDKSEQSKKAGSGEAKDKSCRQKGNLNILQLNISGFSTKKLNLVTSFINTTSTSPCCKKLKKEKMQIFI